MSDEFSIFPNLPRPKRRRGDPDDDEPRFSARDLLTMNFVPEGPMRPRPSGKGGPSINQTPPVVTSSTWSAADATANGMPLSNGNLTMGAQTPGSTWCSTRTTTSHTSGKWYVEFLVSVANPVPNIIVGLANSTINVSDAIGNSNYSGGAWPGQPAHVSAGFTVNYTPSIGNQSPGRVIGMAVDFDAGSFWFSVAGVWTDSGNPATGANPPISFTLATVGALFPVISLQGGNVTGGSLLTLQAIAASQTYAPPSGFTPWG